MTLEMEPLTRPPTSRPNPDLKYNKCPTCEFYNTHTQKSVDNNPKYCECKSMCISDGDEYVQLKIDTQKIQSFDQIIMECQDMLSVETEVKKAYEKWLGVRVKKRGRLKIDIKDGYTVYIKLIGSSIISGISLFIWAFLTPHTAVRISANVFGCGSLVFAGMIFLIVKHAFKLKYTRGKSEPKKQPTETNKFQFLKESYVGTIQKLDDRLNIIKSKINTQIDAHTQDKEQVLQYQDMFDETETVVHKIERAISSLRDSHDKVSEKKAELNKTLTDYIGENGYISQKEQELERIKVAQELSDRMQTNFGKTMEIVKNVDVLTDAIIPGIKQLMEFRIPELIEKVEFECDKERVMLEVSR